MFFLREQGGRLLLISVSIEKLHGFVSSYIQTCARIFLILGSEGFRNGQIFC